MMGIDVIGIVMFVFGAIVGSFLNVCIVRLPHEQSVVKPRSHCVHCNKMIPWYDNIPFFSYMILLGRCRFCRKKISIRYILVELITGLAFFGLYKHFGFTDILWPYIVMISCFIVATFVDFEHRIIPDEVSVEGMKWGMLFSCLIPALHAQSFHMLIYGRPIMRLIVGLIVLSIIYHAIFKKDEEDAESEDDEEESIGFYVKISLLLVADVLTEFGAPKLIGTNIEWITPYILSFDASIIGALSSGGLIYLMGEVGRILFKKEAMGAGDVKFLAMVGAFMGWQMAILAFFLAPFFGSVYGIIEKIRTKDSHIAYGPFLVLGAVISLIWGGAIIDWIVSGCGLY